MPDYKTMYVTLPHTHGQALELLVRAGRAAEALALEAEEPVVLAQRQAGAEDDRS